jgi:pimeloyl-ACP methyl ester carboxylesterase
MRIGRTASAVATATLFAGLASAAYQAAGEARDRREHPPPGRLVDVGGYRLHMMCAGEGTPPVVICPALGSTADEWADVQCRVARVTSVCVYDRAGLGHSDPPRKHRTAVRMAAELHALLQRASIRPPYLLAGHSMGGLLARAFVAMYPAEVAGLALIDSSHPQQQERLPKTDLRNYPGGMPLVAARRRLRPLAIRRLARDLGLGKAASVETRRNRRAAAAELLAFRAIRHQTSLVADDDLGELPLVVLTSAELAPNLDDTGVRKRRRFYASWAVLQSELAALSTNSVHVIADHGGHQLNGDNPELVAKVVIDLVNRARPAG